MVTDGNIAHMREKNRAQSTEKQGMPIQQTIILHAFCVYGFPSYIKY